MPEGADREPSSVELVLEEMAVETDRHLKRLGLWEDQSIEKWRMQKLMRCRLGSVER